MDKKGRGIRQTGELFEPGEILLTDAEKKTLEIAGWKKGDPLPGPEFAKAVQAAKDNMEKEYQRDLETLEKSNKPPLKFATKDIKDLPLKKQIELKEMIEKTKAMVAENEGDTSDIAESVLKAVKEIKEDRLPKIKLKSSDQDLPQTKESEKTEELEKIKEEDSRPVESVAGSDVVKTHCQHCGWDLSLSENKPERSDAFLFVQSLLSGKPFIKSFSLLGGKFVVNYRTLPVDYSDMCLRQAALDTANEKIRTQDEFFTALLNYRLILGLSSLVISDVEHSVSASVDDYLIENKEVLGKSTPLPELLNLIRKIPPMDQEPVWRLIGKNYQRFNTIVSSLEARADDPDFYQAIVASL